MTAQPQPGSLTSPNYAGSQHSTQSRLLLLTVAPRLPAGWGKFCDAQAPIRLNLLLLLSYIVAKNDGAFFS